MSAFIIDRYGKHETGRLAEVPEPLMRDDDVLIETHAASVNQLDTKIRSGEFKLILPYRMPLVALTAWQVLVETARVAHQHSKDPMVTIDAP